MNKAQKSNQKVVKYKKQRSIDIHIIILLLVFIYFIVTAWTAFNKKNVSIYEVTNSSIINSSSYKAFVLMNQELITSTSSGYINYYFRDGSKAGFNDVICSIGSSKQSNSLGQENGKILTTEELQTLNQFVGHYTYSYDSAEFNNIYDFKYSLESKLYEIHNMTSYGNSESLSSEHAFVYSAPKSGLVSYTLTGYEEITMSTISEELFTQPLREAKYLLAEPNVTPGSTLYKIIPTYNWSLIFPIPDKDLEYINDNMDKTISIRFTNSGIVANAKVSKFEQDNTVFAKLDFDALLSNFILHPFVDIEIVYNKAEGLKIPNSAIVEKEFYKVPLDYIYQSKGTNTIIPLNIANDTKEGQIEVELYLRTDDYALILSSVVEAGTVIKSAETQETFTLGETLTLKGVYSVNKGYTVFRRIETVLSTDSFTIIKKGTSYGISLFDHIATNAALVAETEIIY